jgi:hypothetical protein
MIKQTQDEQEQKVIVPSIKELITWHNQFGRMLEPNGRRTKLYGVDGKEVRYIERSRPTYFWTTEMERDSEGRCLESIDTLRLNCPDGRKRNLTYPECDLVLGSNYHVIDQSYSSPSPRIRKIVFSADLKRPDKYNAFELGEDVNMQGEVLNTIIYYRISHQRFRELRDYQTNIDSLVEAVKSERANKD